MTSPITGPGKKPSALHEKPNCERVFIEMEQRKNAFLATLAHELRNPLAPITNGLQLLALMPLSNEVESIRAMMARQVEQLVHLVDDLLDVSRIAEGKVQLDKQICGLSKIIGVAIEESAVLISERKMTLTLVDESNAACVWGDPTRLIQVVSNLLNNSAKYGRNGGKIRLELNVHRGIVIIRVQDDGIGIDASRLKDIFRMYTQIAIASSGRSSGLGIGLALVQNLVELHDGKVEVESDGADCGSTFTVKLPLAAGTAIERVASPSQSDGFSCSSQYLI